MTVTISNRQKKTLLPQGWQSLLRRTARETLRTERSRPLPPSHLTISLTVTDDVGIQELNKTYRGKDKATDVLSFPMYEAEEPIVAPAELGDIVISAERAVAQAQEYQHSIERELAFLFCHGLLHLLGYDHELGPVAEAAMFGRQEEVMGLLGLER